MKRNQGSTTRDIVVYTTISTTVAVIVTAVVTSLLTRSKDKEKDARISGCEELVADLLIHLEEKKKLEQQRQQMQQQISGILGGF